MVTGLGPGGAVGVGVGAGPVVPDVVDGGGATGVDVGVGVGVAGITGGGVGAAEAGAGVDVDEGGDQLGPMYRHRMPPFGPVYCCHCGPGFLPPRVAPMTASWIPSSPVSSTILLATSLASSPNMATSISEISFMRTLRLRLVVSSSGLASTAKVAIDCIDNWIDSGAVVTARWNPSGGRKSGMATNDLVAGSTPVFSHSTASGMPRSAACLTVRGVQPQRSL